MRRIILAAVICLIALLPLSAANSDDEPLFGFTSATSKAERDLETKFRAIPDPKILRDSMQRLSAHPHHVGSPYDKQNAEWILAQFKSWGLDAQIETFNVLFPTPKERVLELTEPTPLCCQAPGAACFRRPDLEPAERTASNLQRIFH